MLHYYLFLALHVLTALAATCAKTKTVYTTVTVGSKDRTSTLSSTTVTLYSSTVLVGTPYAGPDPISTPATDPTNCRLSTVTPAAVAQQASGTDLTPDAATCSKITTTITVNYQCTVTHIAYPGPVFVSHPGTLTTKIPNFCTVAARRATDGNGAGNTIVELAYPYFPVNPVDCCVYCAKQVTADLVAAVQVIDCQCLVDILGDYPDKSKYCPRGVEPYGLGKKDDQGAFPGPCRGPH